MTLDKRNWILAGSAIALLFILAALLAALGGERRADVILRRPSTFFTDPSGARALLMIMKQLLPGADQWRQPLTRLPLPDGENSPSTLIVGGPLLPISKVEAEHLDRWLFHGGQLILASVDGWPLRRRQVTRRNEDNDDVERSAEESDDHRAAPKHPGYLLTHAPSLRWAKSMTSIVRQVRGPSVPDAPLKLLLQRHFAATGNLNIIAAASDNAALAVELPMGRGRIVAIADPMAISNGALRAADNSVWLVTLAAAWGNGMVLFDEYHQGFGAKRNAASLAWALSKTPWGWCLWQIIAAGLLYFFVYRRRFGRISEPPLPEHSSPLELADARAGIFQAAGAQRLAVELIMQNLSLELSQSRGKVIDAATLNPQSGKHLLSRDSADRLAELQTLSAKIVRGERLSEREFTAVGRLAGALLQGEKAIATEQSP